MSTEQIPFAKRRIALIGPGSIGCCVAAALLGRGHELVFAARVPFERLRLDTPGGLLDFAAHCVGTPQELGSIDAAVLTTKAHQTVSAQSWLLAVAAQRVPIFVAQNGVDQAERTLKILADGGAAGLPAVVPSVVYCAAHRRGPGHAVLEGAATLIVPATDDARMMASLFEGSFIRIDVVEDWVTAAWNKLLINASLGPLCALTGRTIDVLADPGAASLAQALVEEVIAVGRAAGAKFDDGIAQLVLQRALKNGAGHSSSIAQDRLAGLPTEWVARNEVVVRLGAKYGIPVPLNSAMTTLMRLGEP